MGFSVRPLVIEGEILTSYLNRVASENFTDLSSILKIVNEENKYDTRLRRLYRLDTFTDEKVDTISLAQKLNIPIDSVYKMTFIPFINKICDDNYYNTKNVINSIPKIIEVKVRKYCPLCVKNQSVFKLMWQVKSIEMCNVHMVKLTSTCWQCNKEQPYFSNSLPKFTCKFRERRIRA